ncbi:MAG TPA: hypothetical protein VGA67_00285, partial [Candidatus Dojkabacteria bacterium]
MINAVMELGQILGQTSYRYSTTSSSDEAAGAIFGGAFFFCYLIVIVAIYIYMAICLSKIAEKAG